ANLSAVDILSACNLVNYFGRMVLGGSGVEEITLYPILIKKGITSVALYSFGNIIDEHGCVRTSRRLSSVQHFSASSKQVINSFVLLV
ncbi:double-strand break repair protein MRE11, partial [Tanacetum coccineum]